MNDPGNSQVVLAENEDVAKRVLHGIDAMLGYWDVRERCKFGNTAYRDWFGISPADLLGLPIRELLGPLYELNLPHIRAALKGEPQVFERAIPMPDGSVRHSIASYHPDISNGVVQGFTAHVTDVTKMKLLELELKAAREQAERMATHDYLTGLPNRVMLTERIQAAITSAKLSGGLAGIVAIDFDGFKKINDMFGHDMGDYVLKEIARRMQASIRVTDTVTRLGGDEFILLATDLNICDGIHRAINRMRLMVCQPLHHKGATFHPQFCCGVAVFPWHGSTPLALMVEADRALYKAKRKGPGRIVFARAT
jgi:diguanylate cyclase (GGDEF)-like protein/PAS domain S-box-containing protein